MHCICTYVLAGVLVWQRFHGTFARWSLLSLPPLQAQHMKRLLGTFRRQKSVSLLLGLSLLVGVGVTFVSAAPYEGIVADVAVCACVCACMQVHTCVCVHVLH